MRRFFDNSTALIAMAVLLLGVLGGPSPTSAIEPIEPLTLRVNDAYGVPGGIIAVVLRTYSSRPISQGQLCMQFVPDSPGVLEPLAAVVSVRVFSTIPDVTANVTGMLTEDPQAIVLSFDSPSITVNASDGPLAVFFMKLDPAVLPGATYELVIDLGNTLLLDGSGEPIEVRQRSGTLTIRDPSEEITVSASAEDVIPGDKALLSFSTAELFAIGSGRATILYDPTIADGAPTVFMRTLHGQSNFTVDLTVPGRVQVDFFSSDGSLNEVPGDIVEIWLPTRPDILVGTTSSIAIDPSMTFLNDPDGNTLDLNLESDLLEFVSAPTLLPGAIQELRIDHTTSGQLRLDWQADCGSALGYSIYRGDLTAGYDSIESVPGLCSVNDTSVEIPMIAGLAEFFLVVPFRNELGGSYGVDSVGDHRSPPANACWPSGEANDCAP